MPVPPRSPLGWPPVTPSPLLGRLYAHAVRGSGLALDAIRDDALTAGETSARRPENHGGAVTFAALWGRALSLSRALRDGRSSLDGAPIAFLIPPGRAYVEVLLGVLVAGGTAVPLSPLHTAPELGYIVGNAAPARLIAAVELAARAAAAAPEQPVVTPDELGGEHGADAATAAADPSENPGVGATAPAIMLYTSGTTGRPKGVVLSHGAVAATLASLEIAWRWRHDDRLLHVLPLHHTHGLIVGLLGALWAGATTSFLPFDAAAVWDGLARATPEITVFMAVPTMYAKLIDAHRAAAPERRAAWSAGARRLRLFTSGSAALPAPLLRAFEEATGQTILERYGMTEIGMALSNRYDGPRVAGAVGVPLPGVEVVLVGDDEHPARDGDAGELRVRSPQLFSGYHGDPAATAATFDGDGRFRTGDTGVRDPGDGLIRLLGRTSVDVLKSGGYKISALEIEAALREHPAIADLAVIGLPDPTLTWGDLVTACVVPRAGATLTLDELKAFARDRLAVYKIPRALRLLNALPRNAMGKVQKGQLIEAELGARRGSGAR
jgi:malonyl-CoA/methylmalonyl-CoA synthetase